MKNHTWILFVVLITGILAGCSSSNGMIEPGDKIGDFQITTGKGDDVNFEWDLSCEVVSENAVFTCQTISGKKVNVSSTVYDETFSNQLDALWADHTHEMFINDRQVNLDEFGTVDINHPTLGTMRAWNVVIVTDKPGEIKVHDKGIVGNQSFDFVTIYVFTKP